MTRQRRRYASDDQVEHMVSLGRRLGLDVAGFEVSADGAIKVLEARAMLSAPAAGPASDFDRFASEL